MRILAFETSCDDTACAIVDHGRMVRASVILNQNNLHQLTGGVVPEVAARQHLEVVHAALDSALTQANCTLADMDAIAATLGPGLVGSLLVGVNTAKTLALLTGKPFIPVHHLVAHVCANLLETQLSPPFICLLVSGGHTQLMAIDNNFNATVLGETLDDAVGEAYDKVGRLLGFDFPGGPKIDAHAALGDPSAYPLPMARTQHPYDFSYSGLKTAMARLVEKERAAHQLAHTEALPEAVLNNLCASFQHAAITPLVEKTLAYVSSLPAETPPTVTVCGGVSANKGLRAALTQACQHMGVPLFMPGPQACTDNAAMVAAAAYFSPWAVEGDPLAAEVFSRQPMPGA